MYNFENKIEQQFTKSVEDMIDGCPVAKTVCSKYSKLVVSAYMDGILKTWYL